ncbi:DNA-directed RNA polymerases I and III subunit RPAC2 [Sesbania bispinosa]|nr:DNA-directed RNA polymerases I and III subunit RPAC2 [Sesbania bispinosa]
MASTAEPSPYYSSTSRRRDESEFNLREWGVKARISGENTNSRRYSGSYMRSFREDTRSFRSNITISSTASSPGYPIKDEIDPSTYSFTTALKALQARAGYNSWECLSPDGFALNSKWNEAERITMSAPLVYSSRQIQTKPSIYTQEDVPLQFPIQEKKKEGMTRDVGTQSTPPILSSSSPSPASTPSIIERSKNRPTDSPNSNAKTKSEEEICTRL